jgi:hypothetical protein
MDTPERYEQLIAYLMAHLPSPVEQEEQDGGVLVFSGGSPCEVIVRLTATHVIVEEFAVRWDRACQPVISPRRVGSVNWRRLPESVLMNVIGQLIKGAREMRLARYRACRFCGRTTAPEWLYDADLCHTCSEEGLGAVH